jgi:hypothetical protein
MSHDEVQSVRDRIKRMHSGAPTAPIDVKDVRLSVAILLHTRRTEP